MGVRQTMWAELSSSFLLSWGRLERQHDELEVVVCSENWGGGVHSPLVFFLLSEGQTSEDRTFHR